MEATDWSITTTENDCRVETKLFTYSEDEREEQRINKMNADLILNPQFIPVNPRMLQRYSLMEATVYWFMSFFLVNNDRFYCTNEQMAEMLNTSEKTISLAVKRLSEDWLIQLTYKVKSGGGKIRFIKIPDFTKSNVPTLQNVISDFTKSNGIENKIIENKKIKENIKRKGYWEFGKCMLSEWEYNQVINDYWLKNWELLINQVDNYCASKWKAYKNYVAAIRNFAKSAWINKLPNKTTNESWIYDLPF